MADTKGKKIDEVKEIKEETKEEEIKEAKIEVEDEYIPDALDEAIAADREIYDLNDDIDIKIQKLEAQVEEYEFKLAETEIETMPEEEYLEKKQIIKDLYKQKRMLSKKTKTKSGWDQISVWIIIYGFIQLFICLPYVPYDIISNWIIRDVLYSFSDSPMVIIVLLTTYAFPFLNVILSWLLFVNVVKKKLDKKVFLVIFILQIVITLFSAFYIYFRWLGDLLARL